MTNVSQKNSRLLDRIHEPADVRALPAGELDRLCGELREELVRTIAHTGGHLSSNLGVVELTVALHREFESPTDQIVWDVGHQCYVHKLLTGRAGRFHTLRQEGGVTGFPSPRESEHDTFVAGHSSTAISAANGLAKAKKLLGEEGYAIAVVGDGALTGGLAYEGLSNAGRSKDKLIVILNDNGMSISQNVGYVARHLATLKAKPLYVRFKNALSRLLVKIPLVGVWLQNRVLNMKTGLKKMLYKQSSFFEEMGFRYIGPLNGHDIDDLVKGFQAAKNLDRPALIHVATVKGKGVEFAERNPDVYHGVSGFNERTGAVKPAERNFSGVFGEELCELALQDERICAITAAMRSGTGLDEFGALFPKRLFDVGIAESHAVTFAAGLAHNQALPVFAVYSTFLQRAYDQIINDAAISGERITLAIDRAGITGDDGETHQGIFDVPFLNTIPNMTIFSPCNFAELKINLKQAVYDVEGMSAVRYPRGGEPGQLTEYEPDYKPYAYFEVEDARALIVTYGRLFGEAATAAARLKARGVPVSVLKLTRILPVDADCIELIMGYRQVYFFEEGSRAGGTGEMVGSRLQEAGFDGRYRLTAIDGFVPVCRPRAGLERYGLDARGMTAAVLAGVNEEAPLDVREAVHAR